MKLLGQRDLKDPHLLRAGAIPYLRDEQGLAFLCAIDNDYRNLIDFGGHRDPEDFDILETIRREVKEETYGALDFSREDLLSSLSFLDEGNLEILVPLSSSRKAIASRIELALEKAEARGERLESIGVIWIPGKRFLEILCLSPESGGKLIYPKVWEPLQELISRH